MTHEASQFDSEQTDSRAEPIRSAIETQIEEYVKAHYPNGSTSVYGSTTENGTEITVCIEDHEFQSRNHWGGRWARDFEIS